LLDRFPPTGRMSFDVMAVTAELGIPVLYRPLQGLWGAAVTMGTGVRGILITTKLNRAIQRFTLAHELGHLLLGHTISLDESVGVAGRFGSTARTTYELAADTFASELLAPRRLMLAASKLHRWTKQSLGDPSNIYQLSLRLGTSYKATCWALAAQNIFPPSRATDLQNRDVAELKQAIAPKSEMMDSWADVWRLTSGDADTLVEAGPNDIFDVQLEEQASTGFLWQLADAGDFSEVLDNNVEFGSGFGESSTRHVRLRFTSPGTHRLLFEHLRPWNKQTLAHIDVHIDNEGKETGGISRMVRRSSLARLAS